MVRTSAAAAGAGARHCGDLLVVLGVVVVVAVVIVIPVILLRHGCGSGSVAGRYMIQ